MIQVRRGTPADVNRVKAFYAHHDRTAPASTSEQFVLAEDGANLIGAVRLCVEEGVLVLRTMRVNDGYQRRGIGTEMLKALATVLKDEDCYCLPFAHLTSFYGQIGFIEIPPDQAPGHLQRRNADYRAKGQRVTVMKRPAADSLQEARRIPECG